MPHTHTHLGRIINAMTHDDERTGAIEIPLAQTVSSFSKGHRTGLAFSLVVTMAAAAAAAAITRRHILCLGDSLTEGYYSWGMKFHPYARRLQEHLDGLGMVLSLPLRRVLSVMHGSAGLTVCGRRQGSFHLVNAGVSGETSEEVRPRCCTGANVCANVCAYHADRHPPAAC